MPFTTADVEGHKAGLSAAQKTVWVRVANGALSSCEEAGKSDCEGSAIRQANAVAKQVEEGAYVLFEAEMSDNDVRQALEQAIRAALPRTDNDGWVWVADVFDTTVVYEDNRTDTPGLFRSPYTIEADGSVMLGQAVKVARQTLYVPIEESEPGLVQRVVDAAAGLFRREAKQGAELHSDIIPLKEASVREDGIVPVKLIQPGWGTSAFYPAEVLERDGPTAFAKGTHMFLDHPTVSEGKERPERSVRDLVGALTGDARWMAEGPDGPGLYGDAEVIAPFRDALDDLAPHIGVSIRAMGEAPEGEREGRKGPVLERFDSGISVDFVTAAGAGGKVLELMESARGRLLKQKEDGNMPTEQELKEAQDGRVAAEKERDELKEAQTTQGTELARLREGEVLREATAIVTEALGKVEALPEMARTRLVESLSKAPPTKDGQLDKDALDTAIEEAAKAEVEYLAGLTKSGSIAGMGGSGGGTEGDQKALEESWKHMHPEWTPEQIAIAINGR